MIGAAQFDPIGRLTEPAELEVTERPAAGRTAEAAPLELIEGIYRQHSARFRRVAYGIVRDPHTADDVVQEAFARATVRRASFRATGEATAWIWRIVVNTAISRQRRAAVERRALQLLTRAREPAADGEAPDPGLLGVVRALPPRQRAALFLRYYAGMDYASIADTLSIAPGTVGKLLHDAREQIRRALEDHAGG